MDNTLTAAVSIMHKFSGGCNIGNKKIQYQRAQVNLIFVQTRQPLRKRELFDIHRGGSRISEVGIHEGGGANPLGSAGDTIRETLQLP